MSKTFLFFDTGSPQPLMFLASPKVLQSLVATSAMKYGEEGGDGEGPGKPQGKVTGREGAILNMMILVIVILTCETFCIMETPEGVLWQTVKTEMKCRIKQHFIRVCTVCKDKNDLQRKKYIFVWN